MAQEEARAKIKVAIAPLYNTSDPRFPNVEKQGVRQATGKRASEWLKSALEEAGYYVVPDSDVEAAVKKLELDFSKDKHRNKESFGKLGTDLGCGFVIFVWITRVHQENVELSAAISNIGKPMSESRTDARIWLWDVTNKKLELDGKGPFQGTAKGPYFGTTKRSEMSGNPKDVSFMILQENKRRAEWMGKAAAVAVHAALGAQLGLKQPK